MSTAQQWLITGTIAGAPIGVFDTCSGGEITAEPTKHRPGGMGQQSSNGALPEFGDLTIGRELDLTRDLALHARLAVFVGRADMVVSRQPLDVNGAPFGKSITYTGRMSGLTDPETDSNSAETSMYEITMIVTGRS